MSDTPNDMRRIASAMSYNNPPPEPAAKHLLISAAMQIEELHARLAAMTALLQEARGYLDPSGPFSPNDLRMCVNRIDATLKAVGEDV